MNVEGFVFGFANFFGGVMKYIVWIALAVVAWAVYNRFKYGHNGGV